MKTKLLKSKCMVLLLCSLAFFSITPVFSSEEEPSDVPVYPFPHEPVIDGNIDECWNINEYQFIEKISDRFSGETGFSIIIICWMSEICPMECTMQR
jgi:hypothetical protein